MWVYWGEEIFLITELVLGSLISQQTRNVDTWGYKKWMFSHSVGIIFVFKKYVNEFWGF